MKKNELMENAGVRATQKGLFKVAYILTFFQLIPEESYFVYNERLLGFVRIFGCENQNK